MTTFDGTPVTTSAADTFRAQATAAGVPEDQIAATLAWHGIAPQQQEAEPDPGTSPHALPMLDPITKHGGYTAAQAQQAYDAWVKLGLPEEQIRAALAHDGFEEVETGEPEATELETGFDAAFAGGTPNEYDLSGAYLGREGADIGDLAAVDHDMRAMLSAMAFPKVMARAFVGDLLDANERGWASLTDDHQRHTYASEQRAIAIRATGAASWEDLISTSKVAFDRIPKGIALELAERGVFEAAPVLAALFRQGERLVIRQGLKARR
jgi:hypothetical protein